MHGADPEIVLGPEDDDFHTPSDADPFWNETVWFSFTIPERNIQGYVYPWVRANQKLLGGGVWVWDHSAHQPWDILFWDNQYNLPFEVTGDLRDIRFPNGISIQCLKANSDYRVQYEHPELQLDFTFEAIMEPLVLARSETGLFAAHVDQPGRVRGTMSLRGEKIDFDAHAVRDRAWGPRVEDRDLRMAYLHGSAERNAFLAFAHPDDASDPSARVIEAPISAGYLLRDGEAAVLVDGLRRIERPGDWPTLVHVEAVDSLGRRLEAKGECVNRLSFTNIPWMFNWCSLTRWEFDGVVGWGEDQDVWHLDRWRRWIRERRAMAPADIQKPE